MGRKNAKKLIPKSNKNYVLETDVQMRMELPFSLSSVLRTPHIFYHNSVKWGINLESYIYEQTGTS